jgi:hypothetical protein
VAPVSEPLLNPPPGTERPGHLRIHGDVVQWFDGDQWRDVEFAPPAAVDPTDEQIVAFLDSPVPGRRESVRHYLGALAFGLIDGEASTNYGITGSSDWRYDLYQPLANLGLIPRWRDGYGIEYPADGGERDESRRRRAHELIARAVELMAGGR